MNVTALLTNTYLGLSQNFSARNFGIIFANKIDNIANYGNFTKLFFMQNFFLWFCKKYLLRNVFLTSACLMLWPPITCKVY